MNLICLHEHCTELIHSQYSDAYTKPCEKTVKNKKLINFLL